MRFIIFLMIFMPMLVLADVASEYPGLDRQVQVNASSVVWPNRVFIRWKLSDGRWWCTYDTKENVRAAMIQNIDDMLAPYGSGATSWRDVNLMLYVGTSTLGGFEKAWCFSWLPQ